jgi:integrase
MGQSRPAKFARPSAAPRIPTPKEVERPIATARLNRYRHRDAIMIRVAYRHGLRVAELCALRWDQVVFGREECDLTGVPTHGARANIHGLGHHPAELFHARPHHTRPPRKARRG